MSHYVIMNEVGQFYVDRIPSNLSGGHHWVSELNGARVYRGCDLPAEITMISIPAEGREAGHRLWTSHYLTEDKSEYRQKRPSCEHPVRVFVRELLPVMMKVDGKQTHPSGSGPTSCDESRGDNNVCK